MEKRVLTVLRSGGEYGPEHVQAIQRQLRKWAPKATLTCLSDVEVPGVERIPLQHDWPGWWAKIELFRPELPGDFLYTDLDNVILGELDDSFWTDRFTADIGFSFFRVTSEVDRAAVFEKFCDGPDLHMPEWATTRADGKFGDAAFLRWRCGLNPTRWGDSVKNVVDLVPPCPWRVAPPAVPKNLRVMLCGGKRRRPWLMLSNQMVRAYWCREK